MKHKTCLLLITTIVLAVFVPGVKAQWYIDDWQEYSGNPVFSATDRSYCPSVVYDSNKFSGHGESYYYKMWYNKKTAAIGYCIGYAYSDDGISWTEYGVVKGESSHEAIYPITLYDANKFGNPSGVYYKMWYLLSDTYPSASEIWYCDSNDGKVWANQQKVLSYNPGLLPNDCYGPDGVLYNPSASNSGSDPMDYSFAMYVTCFYSPFATALFYSADGISWSAYVSGNPNNDIFPSRSTAQVGIAYPTRFWVVKAASEYVAFYDYFYSDGDREIRCATSPDGKTGWTDIKVIFSVRDSPCPSWRADRTYQACVLVFPTEWKMWFSGVDSAYSVGYATTKAPALPVGGKWASISKFKLLTPWITLASLLAVTALLIVYVKHRKIQQN